MDCYAGGGHIKHIQNKGIKLIFNQEVSSIHYTIKDRFAISIL